MADTSSLSFVSKRSKSVKEALDPAIVEFLGQYNKGDTIISVNTIMKGISDLGFDLSSDPRLDEVKDYLSGKEKIDIQDLPRFFLVSDLLYNALRHSLAIPHIKIFRRNLEIMFDSSQLESDGKVSEEIPYLSKQDPSLWALSVISINGQVINFGNTRARFVLGRCSRVILFALGVKLLGIEQVRRILGMDFSFIEKIEVLNNKGVPANMMSNAGAMTLASWIRNVGLEGKTDSEVFDSYDSFIKDLCGETSVKFSNIAFMSERELSKKNHALIYYLRNHKCLPEKNNPEKDVDFYITAGSYEVDCEGFAMFGATIANYGKNVYTPKRVLPRDVCRHTLAMMSICAPHKFWPYKVNLPACGGAEGSLLVIFPSVMSLVLLSPKVDQNNCSVKAFKLVESLSQAYYLNRFEEPSTSACDDSPCLRIKSDCPYQCWVYQAAINNDIFRTVKMVCNDTSVCRANYIGRTVLHEAAAAGHIQIVKLLISACPRLIDVKDKAGQTPMEDAILFGHTGVVKYLENWYIVKTGSPYQRRESSVENKPAV